MFLLIFVILLLPSIDYIYSKDIPGLSTINSTSDNSSQFLVSLKQMITHNKIGEDFIRIEKKLMKQIQIIRSKGNNIIPVISFDRLKKNRGILPKGVAEKVRKRGVLIVRQVISKDQIDDILLDLLQYIKYNNVEANRNQTIYDIFWSQAQMKVRQHFNLIMTQKALLKLWSVKNESYKIDLNNPLMYIDRIRMRAPGDSKYYVPPHIDNGGFERWSNDQYRKVYRNILNGNYEDYDPFEADYRSQSKMTDFLSYGNTFFRAFQGWISLSNSGPGSGTLKVLPLLKETTAYWILRPLINDVPKNLFPGYYPGKPYHITSIWHSKIFNELISIPKIYPGDTIWWHPDVVHSMEPYHNGNEHNSVIYLSTGPDCLINKEYLRRMRHSFILGISPPDFSNKKYNESIFLKRATMMHIDSHGRKSMDWTELSEIKIKNTCSQI